MAKTKGTVFFCQNCGYESAKWQGQCPGCHEWNTFVEEPAAPKKSAAGKNTRPSVPVSEPVRLSEISADESERTSSGMAELDRVLGGGIVSGSLILVGGDPGIGKSTLLLQVCRDLVNRGHKVLYISGEESARQLKLRAQRVGRFAEELMVLCETNLDTICEVL